MSDVIFLCWGNICRSPMAERIARGWAERLGRDDVSFTSAGTSSENLGDPIDPRAVRTLRAAGYDPDGHVAHRIGAEEARSADLVVAMEQLHLDRLRDIVGDLSEVATVLLSDLDPNAEPGSGVVDPWYGDEAGFADTLASLEAAMPGLFERLACSTRQG